MEEQVAIENPAPRRHLRAAIAIAVLVLVVAAVWATAALAGGGSSSEPQREQSPASAETQQPAAPTKEDCPNRDHERAPAADL